MSPKILKILGLVAVIGIFSAVLWLLHRELRHVNYHDIMRQVRATPLPYLLAALGLTVLSYLTLTCYDYMGLKYAGKPLPYKKTAFASFIAYVFSHNVGLSMFGGLAFRYRIYSSWDLTAMDVARVAIFCGVTFWLGLLTLGGVIFTVYPPPALAMLPIDPWIYRLIGVTFLFGAGLYLSFCWRGGTRLRFKRWEFALPTGRLAVAQAATATVDWILASTTLYVLFPAHIGVGWLSFLSVYMLASVAGLISHVPAGLGVVETVMIMAFSTKAPPDAILGSLLVYRAVYYLGPLVVALGFMGWYEIANATGAVQGATVAARRWFEAIIPRVLSMLVFATGVVLLFSGAMPAVEARRQWLENALPLAFVETSHLLGSITGAALLILARGLQRRLDGAYLVTTILLAAGIFFSLTKGVDYEEALVLTVTLLLLLPCRSYFYRKASLLDARFSPGWIVAIALTLLSMLWLAFFTNKHVEYSDHLWWTFTFAGDAPRALRAAVGAVALTLLAGVVYLLRPARAPRQTPLPGPDLERLVKAADHTYANLALLGDKQVLLNQAHSAFIMYSVEGRSWVSMGDPVGPSATHQELIWRFRDMVDRYGGWPVFYQIDATDLKRYVDSGFSLLKIGEEAVVDLGRFSLDGKSFKHIRNTVHRLAKDGWICDVLPACEVAALLPELTKVSTSWLAAKKAREARFSLGFFDPAYLDHFPLAVVRRGGELVAFANLWETESRQELSIDLMRYGSDAPAGTMDFLLVSVMQWGKEHAFATFNLGMAPFSGMESRRLEPLWSRLGARLYEHGERFYNFQGLREYKEKFAPDWRPKYLASPAGRALPVILTDVATLIAGGWSGTAAPVQGTT